jgi:hypothetical protein
MEPLRRQAGSRGETREAREGQPAPAARRPAVQRLLAENSAQRREQRGQAAAQRQRQAEPQPAEDSASREETAPASEVRWRLAAGLLRAASLFVALECWLAVPAVPSRFAPVTAATRQERRGRANKVRCPPAPPAL